MRRLKNYYKKQKNAKPEKKNECSTSPRQDYFVVIDFEGTCEEENTTGYIHEIIEFPAILVNARTLELVCCFISTSLPPSIPLPQFIGNVLVRQWPAGLSLYVSLNILEEGCIDILYRNLCPQIGMMMKLASLPALYTHARPLSKSILE